MLVPWAMVVGGVAILVGVMLQRTGYKLQRIGLGIVAIGDVSSGIFRLAHITGSASTVNGVAALCGAGILIYGVIRKR